MTGQVEHDPAGAAQAMADWSYPRIWLDFETVSNALPVWPGCSPYEQVPFQFVADVEAADHGIVRHEFLDLSGDDPRRACAEALAALPRTGAVIAWHARFERDVAARRAETGEAGWDVDEDFLAALDHGMPASSGIALGFDRLAMLAMMRLVTSANRPEMEIACPAMPWVAPRSAAMGVSRLTGMNSAAMSKATHIVIEPTAPRAVVLDAVVANDWVDVFMSL